jgi:hypothetical protein
MLQDLSLDGLDLEHVASCRLAMILPVPDLATWVHNDLDHACS